MRLNWPVMDDLTVEGAACIASERRPIAGSCGVNRVEEIAEAHFDLAAPLLRPPIEATEPLVDGKPEGPPVSWRKENRRTAIDVPTSGAYQILRVDAEPTK